MNNKYFYISLLFIICAALATAQENPKLNYFSLQDVRLLESPFKHAEDLNRDYLLEMDADRLLAPFLREAGLQPKAESYTNWENSGLDGHIGGHYLSALAQMFAATGD
ncbi:MAG: glycosyl hydrolase, partial [Bacteroidales bacterium]|nr:glycosyl hydrolase [Bacteroidales bacterium]